MRLKPTIFSIETQNFDIFIGILLKTLNNQLTVVLIG